MKLYLKEMLNLPAFQVFTYMFTPILHPHTLGNSAPDLRGIILLSLWGHWRPRKEWEHRFGVRQADLGSSLFCHFTAIDFGHVLSL